MTSVNLKHTNVDQLTAQAAVGKEVRGNSLAEAGDVSDEVSSVGSSGEASDHQKKLDEKLAEPQRYPVNIHRRINALRHLYMDTRKKEHDLQIVNFKQEAETYKNLEAVWKKRLAIVTGKHEPTEEEAKFRMNTGESGGGNDPMEPPTGPDDGQLGVPKFWLVVLNYAAHTAGMIHPQDVAALEFLRDIRVEYTEQPYLGFALVFDFLPNPYFNNTTLTRVYQYSTDIVPAQLYSSSNLMPTHTTGTTVNWTAGKDLTKRNVNGSEKKVDSFFHYFAPTITDLTTIGQSLAQGDDRELLEQAEQAGLDYEIAIALRSRIVPRALLFYTGEADTEGVNYSDYSDDGEYSETGDESSDEVAQSSSELEKDAVK